MDIEKIKLELIRNRRDCLLKESDWTQLPDNPLTLAQREDWAIYRQALRDIPASLDLTELNIITDSVIKNLFPPTPVESAP